MTNIEGANADVPNPIVFNPSDYELSLPDVQQMTDFGTPRTYGLYLRTRHIEGVASNPHIFPPKIANAVFRGITHCGKLSLNVDDTIIVFHTKYIVDAYHGRPYRAIQVNGIIFWSQIAESIPPAPRKRRLYAPYDTHAPHARRRIKFT